MEMSILGLTYQGFLHLINSYFVQNNQYDIAIVGGGIVGLATAYKLQLNFPQLDIVVFEKEAELAFHQTGRNSGVLHSGLYYKPGSLRAENCVKGRKQLVQFAEDNNINFESDMTIGNGLTPYEFEGESDELISGLSVQSAYPNPFNPSTNIEYSISTSGNVKIVIYDVTGRQVDVIHNEYQSHGDHSVVWNAVNSTSGIYYIQIQAQDDIYTQKVVLLK